MTFRRKKQRHNLIQEFISSHVRSSSSSYLHKIEWFKSLVLLTNNQPLQFSENKTCEIYIAYRVSISHNSYFSLSKLKVMKSCNFEFTGIPRISYSSLEFPVFLRAPKDSSRFPRAGMNVWYIWECEACLPVWI